MAAMEVNPGAHSVHVQAINFLSNSIPDNLLDVVLLCDNGRNNGALRLLRTAYEKSVTAHYLWLHPECAAAFVHHENIKDASFLERLTKFGIATSAERREQAETQAQISKRVLNIKRCSECGSRMQSWTKVTTEQMAERTAHYLSTLVTNQPNPGDFEARFMQIHFYCWDVATQLIHSTIKGLDLESADVISPGMVLYAVMEIMRSSLVLRHTALQPQTVEIDSINHVLDLLKTFDYDRQGWIN